MMMTMTSFDDDDDDDDLMMRSKHQAAPDCSATRFRRPAAVVRQVGLQNLDREDHCCSALTSHTETGPQVAYQEKTD